ncbi:hypothetical protein ACFFUE_07330 [Bergeyella porcorum]|uniref:hypothetical protein n=1 Tax=Bergeyella porcorum TaxID=1735111 RepID=UPI0035E6CE00
MKKKSNWLAVVSCLLLMACGSRKSEVSTSETKAETRQTEEVNAIQVVEKKVIHRDTIYLENKSQTKAETQEQRQRQKRNTKREYYENGTLKSESETNETESETITQLRLENEYLKAQNRTLKSEFNSLDHKIIANKNNIDKWIKKVREKQTEREAYPWYWWVISGFVLGVITPWLLKWIGKFYMRI